jgi:hypothetical protein
MTITIELTPDAAERLARKAAREGQDVAGYVQRIAAREAGPWEPAALAAWDRLLDSFDAGEADDHRDTVETLARALNADRPGQRRVFGTGTNPPDVDSFDAGDGGLKAERRPDERHRATVQRRLG